MSLVEPFTVALADRDLALPHSELETALATLVDAARTAFPDIDVDPARFVAYVAERLSADTITSAVLTAVRAADLWLACACADGDSAAVAAFDARFERDVAAILGRIDTAAAIRDEARQLLRHHLFVAADGKLPRIAEYTGRGDLLAFIRVVAVRIALGLLRKHRARGEVGDDDELWALPDDDDDPELAYLKRLYRAELKRAFADGLASLSSRDRTLLRYHLVDGLSIDRLAAIYDVHRATAARQLARARQALVDATHRALRDRLDVDRDQMQSILRLIESDADVSAMRLLQGEAAVTHPRPETD